ncbi:LysR family transcriptional regulator [Weissella bombi]|uniref:DNA-binding transcriptional regulator, LysR family n=1 Tax=Weissella bombi TaxID=1505725 RepID=A0A1C4AID4_9LACO|nr:LysR family transcriptional regulator [Weissella bombi]SCB94296.1 DNA-binding transcriptional regulator, LysR family [Weissella bombi]
MDINKFNVFLDLAKTGNYSETAQRLYTTQGNISKQILALEKELKTKLFIRGHRQITLTESGRITEMYAKKILHEFDALQQTLNKHNVESDNVLTIHTMSSFSNYEGFSLMSAFHQNYPEITLHFSEIKDSDLINSVMDNQADIIFGHYTPDLNHRLETLLTDQDNLVAVLPANHPLSAKKILSLNDIIQEDLLLLEGEETLIFNKFKVMVEKKQWQNAVAYQGKRIDIILNMVSNGMGIALVMDKRVDTRNDSQLIKRKIGLNTTSNFGFMRLKQAHESHGNELFWNYITQTIN